MIVARQFQWRVSLRKKYACRQARLKRTPDITGAFQPPYGTGMIRHGTRR